MSGTGAAASGEAARPVVCRARARFTAPLGATKITRSRRVGCLCGCDVLTGRTAESPIGGLCLLPRDARVATRARRPRIPFRSCLSLSPPAAQVLLVCLFKRYGARQRRRPRARSRPLSVAPMVSADRGRRAVEVRRRLFVYGGGGCVTFTTGDFRHPPKSQALPRARAIEFRACA